MSRFVVLTHDHPKLHWDLLLERGDVLRAFRLAEPPAAGRSFPAEPIPDHRRLYLDYEGPISGGRGSVTRWDGGEFDWRVDSDTELVVVLQGAKFRGAVRLYAEHGEAFWTARCESE